MLMSFGLLARLAGLLSVVTGIAVLLGWALDIAALKSGVVAFTAVASAALVLVVVLFSTRSLDRLAASRGELLAQMSEAQAIAHLGSWEWDIATDSVTWSEELYRIYGLNPERFGGSFDAFLERVHPDDREQTRSVVESAYRTGEDFAFEHRVVRPDNTVRVLQATGRVELDGSGRPLRMVGTGQDITRRKTAWGRVALLQAVAAASNQAASVDECLQVALDEVCKHTGWPVGHVYLVGADTPGEQFPTKLWHLDDPERFDLFRRVTEATPMPLGVGLPGRILELGRPDWIPDVTEDANFPRAAVADDIGIRAGFGVPIWVGDEIAGVLEFFQEKPAEPDEDLLHAMASVGDQIGRVIERERLRTILEASEQRFRAAAATAGDAIVSADSAGEIIYFNTAAEEMFARSTADVLGQSLTLLMPERFHDAHRGGFARYLSTGEPRVIGSTVELAGLRKDGTEFPLELSLATWQAEGRSFFTGIIRDISDRKEAEQFRRQLEVAQLRQQQALELNDNVVQGLAAAKLALDIGYDQKATSLVERTLASARSIISGLLRDAETETRLQPGDLVREKPASLDRHRT